VQETSGMFFNELPIQKRFRIYVVLLQYDLFHCNVLNNNSSSHMQSLTAYFFASVFVVWARTAIGSVVISGERFELDLRLPGLLSSNIIRGPTLSANDGHLCIRDERVRRDSQQNFLRKTLYSVTKSEQCGVSRPQFPWSTHGTPGSMTPLLATKTLAFYDSGFPTGARVKTCNLLN